MEIPEVTIAGDDDIDRCVGALTLAFVADPIMRWIFPDPADFLTKFPEMVRQFGFRESLENESTHYVGDYAGAATWLPPGVSVDEDAFDVFIEEKVADERRGPTRDVLEEMETYHPDGDFWYLAMLGVDVAHQGEGLGSLLMKHALVECDEKGIDAYLESSNPQNIPFYERHGFEQLGRIEIGEVPLVTPMLRTPR